MEMLHTPQELVRLSNTAHTWEGIALIVIAVLIIAQAFGYLRTGWHRYLWPTVALLASLILAGFLFVGHAHELGKAWRVITTDMQQKQHLWISLLVGVGAIAELLAIRLSKKRLHLAFPIAVAIIGILFLVHPQHGSSDMAVKALVIHRVVGIVLLIGAFAQAASVLREKSQKALLIITALAFGVIGGLFIAYCEPKMDMSGMDNSNSVIQSHPTYSLNLMSGKSYLAAKPVSLHYEIQDQTGKVLKDFDVVHEKKMHLIIVRKDRTNFQHVHPTFDESNGMFKMDSFIFPTDGDYRVFADFTPSNAQKDPMGMKLPATPYQDVKAGDVSKYVPAPLSEDKFSSIVNGFDTNIFFAPGDDSPGGMPNMDFYAGQDSTVAISINKDGQAYKNLQTYLGALGHMVVLGPNLEFIHAHAQTTDIANQSGLIIFTVNFPKEGRYKLYLQTQADGQVTTTDYSLTVKPNPGSTNQPMGGMDMPRMEH